MGCCEDFCSKLGLCCLNCFSRWPLWIKPFVFFLYTIVIIVIIPLLVLSCGIMDIETECSKQDRGRLIGGIFALLALPITFWEIIQHLIHYTKPNLQKHIIRVLWMVPIYALDAWLGLLAPQYSIYTNSMRECYEAYVIFNFMKFLLNYLNSEMDLIEILESKQQVRHIFPLCCLRNWEMGGEFIHNCKHGILQYTVVRPLTTGIAFICELFHVYGDEELRANVAFPYILFVNNVSQFIAMYCLVLFYRATKDDLNPIKPIGKFLCIKAVVFFSFFQGALIAILVNTGVINQALFGLTDEHNIKDISASLQNFLICIEMFFAAIAHQYVFSYKAYVDLAAQQPNCCQSFFQMFDIGDVKHDIGEHIGVIKNTVRNVMPSKVYRHPGGMREERAHLLRDGSDDSYSTERPVQDQTRSASLQIIAEIPHDVRTSHSDSNIRVDVDHNFTDLSEYAKLNDDDQD